MVKINEITIMNVKRSKNPGFWDPVASVDIYYRDQFVYKHHVFSWSNGDSFEDFINAILNLNEAVLNDSSECLEINTTESTYLDDIAKCFASFCEYFLAHKDM